MEKNDTRAMNNRNNNHRYKVEMCSMKAPSNFLRNFKNPWRPSPSVDLTQTNMQPAYVPCNGCKHLLMVEENTRNVCCPSCQTITSVTKKKITRESEIPKGNYGKEMEANGLFPMDLPAPRRAKRAVLCGVTYQERKYRLKGTKYDVKDMYGLLFHYLGFSNDSIRLLTDEEKTPNLVPTKENIKHALQWLVQDCQAGDSLVFYFSGHGLRQPDFKNDELDGYDETICPLDFRTEGMILDNDLNTTLVRPLTRGVTLHAIVDACHSGTILDLPYVYDTKRKNWIDNHPPSGTEKGTRGGFAVCISACQDDKLAADTSAFKGKVMKGAMTFSFIEAIKRNPNRMSYGALLDSMQNTINQVNPGNCFKVKLQKLLRCNTIPEPLLSSSEKFDVSSTIFKL